MTRRFGVVKISFEVGLQSHGEFMKVLGHLVIAVKAFDEIGFAITVQISKDCNLISAGDIDLITNDFQSERLEQSVCNSSPG